MVDGNATQLKILHKLAGQHHVELTIVLDFIHVCEYVWKASLGFYEETEPARQVWVQERLLRILRGEACLVAAGISSITVATSLVLAFSYTRCSRECIRFRGRVL